MKITNESILIVILCATLLANFLIFAPYDYEILGTKQYFSNGFYHGGFASKVLDMGREKDYYVLHSEAESNFFNTYKFNSKEKKIDFNRSHAAAIDCLYIPFMASAVSVLGLGFLDVVDSYFILNIAIWLASIFLVYHISMLFFDNRRVALVASILLSVYPVFTLMFQSIKVQHAGLFFMLLGIFFHEKYLFNSTLKKKYIIGGNLGLKLESESDTSDMEKRISVRIPIWPELFDRVLLFTIIFFIGFYCAGGNLFLLLFLAGRYISGMTKEKVRHLFVLALALCIAKLWATGLNAKYHLAFVSENLNMFEMVKTTFSYIVHLPMGVDMEQYSFFKYPGFKFFKQMLPLLIKSVVLINPVIILLAFVAFIKNRSNWKYLLMAFVLLGAHLGTFITGWVFHYGYMSAGTLIILTILAAYVIGTYMDSSRVYLKIVAYFLLLLAIAAFMLDAIPGIRYQHCNIHGGHYTVHQSKRNFIYHYGTQKEY